MISRRKAMTSSRCGTENIMFSFFFGDRTRHSRGRGGRSSSLAFSGSSLFVFSIRKVKSTTNSPSAVPRNIFTSLYVKNFFLGMLFLSLGLYPKDPGRIAHTLPIHQARWCISANSMHFVSSMSRSMSCDSSDRPTCELLMSP